MTVPLFVSAIFIIYFVNTIATMPLIMSITFILGFLHLFFSYFRPRKTLLKCLTLEFRVLRHCLANKLNVFCVLMRRRASLITHWHETLFEKKTKTSIHVNFKVTFWNSCCKYHKIQRTSIQQNFAGSSLLNLCSMVWILLVDTWSLYLVILTTKFARGNFKIPIEVFVFFTNWYDEFKSGPHSFYVFFPLGNCIRTLVKKNLNVWKACYE